MTSLDKLTVDTPEQIALELPLAGLGSRFLAFVYDSLLQFIAFALVTVLLALLPRTLTRLLPTSLAPALLMLFYFCLYWGYFALFEALWKGQTPGKRHAGIRVIKQTGRAINTFEAIGRNLMRAIDALPGAYAVAVVTMLLNRQNRRLGDFVAGTIVVHDRAPEPIQAAVEVAPSSLMPTGDARLTPEQLVLVETFLARRDSLPADVRRLKAVQIAGRISTQLGIAMPPQEGPEQFLESLARQTRDQARFS